MARAKTTYASASNSATIGSEAKLWLTADKLRSNMDAAEYKHVVLGFMSLNESLVEDAALEWFGALGYAVGHGPQLAPDEPAEERDSFSEVLLVGRSREAIRRLNRTQSRSLATLRNPACAGLPKLLSGELSVSKLGN